MATFAITTCPNHAVTATFDARTTLVILAAVVLVVAPVLTAIYLGIRLRRAHRTSIS